MRPGIKAPAALRVAAWALLALSLAVPAQDKSKPTGFRIGVDVRMVTLEVSVLDGAGNWVKDLTEKDFQVFEDGRLQELVLFEKADAPITVGLVLDTSGSMRERLELLEEAVHTFLKRSNPDNQLFVVDFSHDKAELLADFTQDRDDIRDAIGEKMLAGGGTPLWDAVYLAIDRAAKGKFDRKAIVVISDGEDKDSYYSYADVLKKVKTTDLQLYMISLQKHADDSLFDLGGMSRDEALRELQELADTSGGRFFWPENLDELVKMVASLATELRHQYRLGYHIAGVPETPAYRKLEVRLDRPEKYRLRTRKGYLTSTR